MKKSILISILFLLSFSVKSQVVYNHVGNLYPISGFEEIDINNDGQLDLKILFSSGEIRFEGMNGTLFETDGNEILLGFDGGIQLGQQTYESIGRIMNNSSYFPYTSPTTLKFVGLKFMISGVYHCAYLEVGKYDANGTLSFLYESYGYDLDPQNCITTGAQESSVSAEEMDKKEHIKVFPNPFSDKFYVDFKNHENYSSYSIINSVGKIIQSSSLKNKWLIEVNVDLPKGVYFLILSSEVDNKIIKLLKK